MPPLLRLHYIGKCSRTTCAWCGIDTPFDIASNTFYSMRFGEEMREIGELTVVHDEHEGLLTVGQAALMRDLRLVPG